MEVKSAAGKLASRFTLRMRAWRKPCN